MRRYESYKDSGVEWLGKIPSYWDLTIGMNVFRENKRDNKGMKEKTVLSLSYGQIIIKPEEKLVGLVPESFETYQIVKPNDIIIRCTDLQNDQTSLRTGLAKDKGIITSAYLNLKVINNHSAKFLHYYLHTLDITKVLYKFGSGLRQNLSFLDFKRLPIIDIPLSEQQKIAQFLNDKTAKIDQAVDLAEKQIVLLKEHKQILIQNAVTRGLNPDVPLKDSGVEWIGQVPEHWNVKKLKYMGYLYSGLTGKSADDFSKEVKEGFREFVPFTTICNFSQIKENVFQYVKVMNLENQNIVKKHDLLFLMSSETLEDIAKSSVYLLDQESFLNSFCKGFRFIEKHSSIFINYLINSNNYRAYFNLVGRGFTRINIKQEFVNSVYVLLPPFSEQQKIADYLDKQTTKIDQAIALKTAHIEKLKEYKSVLINNVVTGKVQV
ncbi:TPA: restriction endonuclease subunit S [Haemophilus influenzae]|uniref:restriction endonuclease subunit S n=1 Tax=Haemophilus influenzae TaxID=727 RepID=UPI0001A3F7BB|nr:restriction endonuclease subunit S [Haemophilus influenzae]EEP45878.1 type I restriction-modification system S subunit [Haemophilus influenzae 7P49H1]KMZ17209.1 restriction endonuclease subunit S [Haemophilus influenzae]MCK8874002.1 restriction endonuclease subunit S [Haemophilus influenzae]OBX66865.1 restriction endonuclease subunit S [Haemophilus influenzae]PRI24520.1 Type-1 restriction enzyme EcoKI specificity protein [Haemophilus influenzae]